jgi:GH35 family endo-1,4-beta-xylanase
MNRRAFLKTGASVTALFLTTPAWSAVKSGLSDDEILDQAKARIETHRKGDGVILVQNSSGKPVPGAKISLEQLHHEFRFGCNLFQFGRCGEPDREQQYRQQFAAVFNYCTLGFYWGSYEFERGKPNYDYTDSVVEWTRSRGIDCKGHPLVWDHPASSPRWLPDDASEIEKLSNGRVREVVSRYRNRIDIWDVVNEATHLSQGVNRTPMARWGAAIGASKYISQPLKVARAANPDALLVVNDYRIEPAYYELLQRSREEGKPLFDVVGIQSHMHDGVWPLQKVWDTCDTYSRLGRPIHFTETTLLSGPRKGPGENWGPTTAEGEARQAAQSARFYTSLFAHPAVQAITWWDFSDYHAWQHAAAGWLRDDMSPKPVYERMLGLIKGEWWTKTEGRTDRDGVFNTRGFYGRYRVTVQSPGAPPQSEELDWRRATPRKFELRLRHSA